MKQRLVFDVDGVLAESAKQIVRRYNKRTGSHITVDEIDRWDYISGGFDVSAEYKDMWEKEPEFSLKFPPGRLAIDAIYDLYQDGFEIMVVTTRPESAMYWTDKWLRKYRFVTHGLFFAARSKTEVIDCDMLFDDNPLEIELFMRNTGKPAFLKRQPWNRYYYPNGYRVFKVYGRTIWIAGGMESARNVAREVFLGAPSRVCNKEFNRDGMRIAAQEKYRMELEDRIRLAMGV